MNLDELQSVQSRERQATSLQNLRPSFYQDAGEFIQQLSRERDRAAERADDPFSSPEVRRLSDDIQTARQTVEALYERRVGKVVKMASIAAADMPTDDEGLTEEEAALFDALVARIEQNRGHVLDEVLEGETPGAPVGDAAASGPASAGPTEGETAETPADSPPDEPTGPAPADSPEAGVGSTDDPVDAAEMMGAGDEEAADDRSPGGGAGRADAPDAESSSGPSGGSTAETDPEPGSRTEVPPGQQPDEVPAAAREGADAASDDGDRDEGDDVERTTVQVLQDVGEIFGVDERTYELAADEVVTLPAANAEPLLEREAAERLE